MFRFLAFILLLFSFNSFAGKYYFSSDVSFGGVHMVSADQICGSSMDECANSVPTSYSRIGNTYDYCGYSVVSSNSFKTNYLTNGTDCNDKYTVSIYKQVDDSNSCSNNSECFYEANQLCSASGQELKSFQYNAPDSYTYECGTPPDPRSECRDNIIQQCLSNLGMDSYNYQDDGMGGNSCSGICNDQTDAEDQCIETLANNYCDVVEPPSELDFSGGGSGSSVDPSTTTTEDNVNDIPYEADGSTADNLTGMTTLQGDKLINEVVKSRNDNTENLASTTETTNQTIVEKSDDIQNTISNSANGIIDAVNEIVPFYDGNIVDAINNIAGSGGSDYNGQNVVDAIGGLGDKLTDISQALGTDFIHAVDGGNFSLYDSMFEAESRQELEAYIAGFKATIESESDGFYASLMNIISVSYPTSSAYEQKDLNLSGWGSFDISMSRFSFFFGGLGNIIYFLASMTALTIVLGGIRI